MAHPFPLFEQIWTPTREVLVTPEITSALEVGAAVAIAAGVSAARRPARPGVDGSAEGDRGPCGPLALALGE